MELQPEEKGAQSAQKTVCEHLAQEHRRLPKLLAQAEWRVQQKLFPGAERCFAEFCSGLEAHLGEEERIASTVAGASSGMSAAVKTDHEALRRMLSFAADAIRARDCGSFASAASDLRDVLASHRDQEEQLVFPLLEQLTGSPESATAAR